MIDSVFAIIDFYDCTDIFIYIIPLKCNEFVCKWKIHTFNVLQIKTLSTFVSITCLFEVH